MFDIIHRIFICRCNVLVLTRVRALGRVWKKTLSKHKMLQFMNVKIFVCIFSLTLFLLWYNWHEYTQLLTSLPAIAFFNHTKVQNKLQTKDSRLKYILQWTSPNNVPFMYMGVGQTRFIESKCKYTNCYVTSNRYFFDSYSEFDVIAFDGPEVLQMRHNSLPGQRSPEQKYVFASIESSSNYPMCSNKLDGFFNWTWTYKLDSENRWGYLVIRDKQNNIIGPNKVMHWKKLEDMEPVTEDFKQSLKSKTKAAAWFVSNCFTRNRREIFAAKLEVALYGYGLTLDIYGGCGDLQCRKDDDQKCNEIIKTTYFFYLAFENSCSEDYVTEKVLLGLNNNAIPVVFGGANYTRFMPDGIYLNAKKLGVFNLASKMNELIKNPDKYAEYFRWQNHYSYHHTNDNPETDDFCGMCALLNNNEMMKKQSVYKEFKKWWEVPNIC